MDKRFFTFSRYSEGKKDSTNSRVVSILGLMELTDRKLEGTEDVADCLTREIDWNTVQNKLNEFREQSYEWLVKSLRDGGVIQ